MKKLKKSGLLVHVLTGFNRNTPIAGSHDDRDRIMRGRPDAGYEKVLMANGAIQIVRADCIDSMQ